MEMGTMCTPFPRVPSFTHAGTPYTALLPSAYSTLACKAHSRNNENRLFQPETGLWKSWFFSWTESCSEQTKAEFLKKM